MMQEKQPPQIKLKILVLPEGEDMDMKLQENVFFLKIHVN
jgi:hypothetical protein